MRVMANGGENLGISAQLVGSSREVGSVSFKPLTTSSRQIVLSCLVQAA